MMQTKHRATMQRRLSFANSIVQVLLPCADSCFQICRKPPTRGLSLAVLETSKWRPPLSRLLDTWRPGNGKQKQHQWQCVQRCVPGLPEHSLLTERVHVQLVSCRFEPFVLKLRTRWHSDVLHAIPKPNLFHRSLFPPRLDGSPWQPPLNIVAVPMSKHVKTLFLRVLFPHCFLSSWYSHAFCRE